MTFSCFLWLMLLSGPGLMMFDREFCDLGNPKKQSSWRAPASRRWQLIGGS